MGLHQLQRQPRGNDKGNGEGNEHAHRGIDRDRAHVRPHQAGDERHRQQRRDDGKGRQNGRAADFIHRRRDDLPQRLVGLQQVPTMDVLDHDYGVVDQYADREYQGKQGYPVEGEAIRPGGEQGRRQGQTHRRADDHGFAPAQRKQHQQYDEGGGEHQLADQLLRLVGGRRTVIARHREFDAVGNHRALERFGARDHGFGDVGGVDAGLLRNRQRHRRKLGLAITVPDITHRLVGAVNHLGNVGQVHRPGIEDTHHQAPDVCRRLDIGAGLHQDFAVAADQAPGRLRGVRHLQCRLQVLRRDAVPVHAVGIHDDANHMAGAADGRHVARTGNALEIDLGSARHLLQFEGRTRRRTVGNGAVKSQRHDRHVIDAPWLDDRIHDTEVGRKPVAVGIDGVIEPDQSLDRLLAHLVLHGNHRHARTRNGIDVLDAGDARQHLFRRPRHQCLDIPGRGAGEGDEDIGHGDVDLRLFLARRDQGCANAEQQGDQRDQGRQGIPEKVLCNSTGDAHVCLATSAA